MENLTLKIEKRSETGKQKSKYYRREGKVPCVLYGHEEKTETILADHLELKNLVHHHGRNIMVTLKIPGTRKVQKAIIRDIQMNVLTDEIIHVDLQRISLTETIHIEVPIHLTGSANGVRNEGGVLDHILYNLNIECTPEDIPESIEVDVTDLSIGDSIHVRDIQFENGKILTDSERSIVTILPPRVILEPTEVEAEELEEELEEAEPEVIGEKKEQEETED